MSSFLYSLGSWAVRARVLVVGVWVALLLLSGAGALTLGKGANAPIIIPGTESQAALDVLEHTFPEVAGSGAQIVVVAADGDRVEDQPYRDTITDVAETLAATEGVRGVQYPFAELAPAGLSEDGRAALLSIQLEGSADQPPQPAVDAIRESMDTLEAALPEGAEFSYGGQVFAVEVPHLSPVEAVGVVVAFVVLLLTLGSLIAAGLPLVIAITGVGVAMAGLWTVTAFVELTSVTPMLALMLGLAVGIDYTLFIVSRHQEQLRSGMDVDESIARATATSGSAVVFAGLTVMIALVGLFVAGIPFLTALGVAAAAAVAVAVLISVTLTPALLGFAGLRILPKSQRRARAARAEGAAARRDDASSPHTGETAPPDSDAYSEGSRPSRADRFFGGWVRLATAKPWVTLVVVLGVFGAAAIPAADLRLALPDAAVLDEDDPARVTYELVDEHYGPGANGPLLLAGSIITSTDPLGLMDALSEEIETIPGVREVSLATPNQGADTGIIVVIPETGPHDPETTDLVHALRDRHDHWVETYGVSLAVTGFTAVGIDISQKLFTALIPFTIFVVGLSLVLLAMVFRSVWVPIKATLGYLLSVAVAFGAVVAVFQWGWLNTVLNVAVTSPILSFLPIILMGVLFGLAMDYEVFLVSRIREDVAHGVEPRRAIHTGFVGSAKVVTAAALIMFAVFAAFVPVGDRSIKTIALGLAVGVLVDAFVVRMTLVPAVMQLLGSRAWRMPKWLDRVLPHFDVEGEGITREMAHQNWPADQPDAAIATRSIRARAAGRTVPLADVCVPQGEVLRLDPADPAASAWVQLVTGRVTLVDDPHEGTDEAIAKVLGYVLPERAGAVRARATVSDLDGVTEALRDRPELLVIDTRGDLLRGSSEGRVAAVDQARSALSAAHSDRRRGRAGQGTLSLVVIADTDLTTQLVPRGMQIHTTSARPAESTATSEVQA